MLPAVRSFVAVSVVVSAAITAGCGGRASLDAGEPDSVERAAVTEAILKELSLEGALFDDIPNEQLLSTTPSVSAPLSAPLPTPLAKLLRAWGGAVPASCATVESSTDVDADGIPAAASVLFGCSSSTYDVSGTGFVLDDRDTDATSGFAVGLGDVRVSVRPVPAAEATSRAIDGSFRLYVRPDPSPGALDATIDVGVTLPDVSFRAIGVATYLPDADLGPTTRSRRGTVTSTVQATITEQGVTRTWTRSPGTTLHWNLACKTASSAMPGFDGGAVVYTDDRGNALRVELTSCATWNVTLNGAPL